LLLISFGCGSRCRCLWGYGLLYICGWCRSTSYFFNAFYILRDLWFPLLETTNFYQIMRIIKFQNYQKCRSKPDYEYSTLTLPYLPCAIETLTLTFWRRNYFFILAHPVYHVNNTGTKYVRIMKQTAFRRGKNGEYIPCLKYSVPIFLE
jgi:hypothetical protein